MTQTSLPLARGGRNGTRSALAAFGRHHYLMVPLSGIAFLVGWQVISMNVPPVILPTPAKVIAAFFERAIQHYAAVLATGSGRLERNARPLIPRDYRKKFFELMHEDYHTYRPAGYYKPAGARGIEFWLIEHNAFMLYSALEPLNHLRVGVRQALSNRFR